MYTLHPSHFVCFAASAVQASDYFFFFFIKCDAVQRRSIARIHFEDKNIAEAEPIISITHWDYALKQKCIIYIG